MGAGASVGDHVESINGNLDTIEQTLHELDDPEVSRKLEANDRKRILGRLFNIMQRAHGLLDESGNSMHDIYFGDSPGKTRPNKTKAEELIDEVEMEAAVDDEINILLFEFVEVYGAGDEEVDERVLSLFSRPEFNPAIVDSFGNSLVVKGIQEDCDAFVQLALNFGVDPNLCNSAGVTALHLVCYVATYDFDKAKMLCDNGAQPALAVTSTGLTPLHYAVETRDPKLVELLLDAGASPTVQGLDNKTPLDYAKMCHDDDIEHDGAASEGIVEVMTMLESAAASETEATRSIDRQLHVASQERSRKASLKRRPSMAMFGQAGQEMMELANLKGDETRSAGSTKSDDGSGGSGGGGGGGSGGGGSGMSADDMKLLQDENARLRNDNADAENLRKQNDDLRKQAEELREMKAKIRAGTADASKQQQELETIRAKLEESAAQESKKAHALQDELDRQASEKKALEVELEKAKEAAQAAGTDAANAAALVSQVEELSHKVEEANKKNDDATRELKKEQEQRKKLYNEVEDMKGKIRVFARIRPLNSKERKQGDEATVVVRDPCSLKVTNKDKKVTEFNFDSVLGPDSAQQTVFADTKRLVQSAIDGYNVCIFAYGQTGAGKSFTMLGEPGNEGVQPRAISEIFRIIDRDEERYSFKVKFYMLELYKGKFIDLLVPKGKQAGTITAKRNPKGVVEVAGATTQVVTSSKELQDHINMGTSNRHVSATKMNAESSRSHLICAVMIESENLKTKVATLGKLSLVDLAGSERQSKTGATGETLAEAKSINKSLSALGNVIHALTKAASKSGAEHIPYRDDPLTQLMADSLGGNAKTLMFVNVSPADSNVAETISSLNFALRCKQVQNSVSATVETAQIRQLKKQIADMKSGGGGGGGGGGDTLGEMKKIKSKRPKMTRRSSFVNPTMTMG